MKFFFILLTAVAVNNVSGGKSPRGEEYLTRLHKEGRATYISDDIAEDMILDTVGLITKYGYPVEEYTVKTPDGYVLTLHRIPGGKGMKSAPSKSVVFLMHGLLMSSADWVLTGPQKGLGYILADEGFDVWMGNARGNFYSRKHVVYDPDTSSEFWKFSWNEIGVHDLPSMIDFVLEKTKVKKIHYIGHSQGTTSFFVMASSKQKYNDHIKSMHAMAPVAYMSNLKSPLVRMLAPLTNTVEVIANLIGMDEFLPTTELMSIGGKLICEEDSTFLPVCTNILFLLCGYNPDQLNVTMLPVMMSHTPAGSSSRQLVHYGQEFKSKKFRQFDYGILKNRKVYGSMKPPTYNLKNVKAPVALHYSDNDWMSAPKDVDQLHKELPNSIGKYRVKLDKFNHLDYVWATDARKLIYNRIINLMRAFD